MNKYLDLAEKVLANSKSMLTARQIWDYAIRRSYIPEGAFGAYPWLALGRALSIEINQQKRVSKFGCLRGKQTFYHLLENDQNKPFDFDKSEREADLLEDTDPTVLLKRIRSRDPKPQFAVTAATVYHRDPAVIAFVRLRAKHHCEMCGVLGFEKDNGRLYVEVHHVKGLADGGSDIPENAVALCATCHRKLHYENDRDILLTRLVAELAAKNVKIKPQ